MAGKAKAEALPPLHQASGIVRACAMAARGCDLPAAELRPFLDELAEALSAAGDLLTLTSDELQA